MQIYILELLSLSLLIGCRPVTRMTPYVRMLQSTVGSYDHDVSEMVNCEGVHITTSSPYEGRFIIGRWLTATKQLKKRWIHQFKEL
jgi:hypothetical protein